MNGAQLLTSNFQDHCFDLSAEQIEPKNIHVGGLGCATWSYQFIFILIQFLKVSSHAGLFSLGPTHKYILASFKWNK